MPTRISTPARNQIATAVAALVDAGAAAGKVRVYTGAQPARPSVAATGTLLVTFTLNDPAFAAAATGAVLLDVDPAITATAVATGTAGWFRLLDSDDNAIMDGEVGVVSAQMILNTTSIAVGELIQLVSASISAPEG